MISPTLQPIIDRAYLEVDLSKKDSLEFQNKILFIDTRFNPYSAENAVQSGVVKFAPKKSCTNYSVDIAPGDKVYCHYSLTDDSRRRHFGDGDLYEVQYFEMYCKENENGELEMLSDYNLAYPIKEEEKSLFVNGIYQKVGPQEIPFLAKMYVVNKEMKKKGIKGGDIIIYTVDSDRDITIKGERVFYIQNRDIIGVYRGKEDFLMANEWNLLCPIEESEDEYRTSSGIYLKPVPGIQPLRGKLFSINDKAKQEYGVEVGDVIFFNSRIEVQNKVMVDKKVYYYVTNDDLLGVLK